VNIFNFKLRYVQKIQILILTIADNVVMVIPHLILAVRLLIVAGEMGSLVVLV
jgi:hypothetical protein